MEVTPGCFAQYVNLLSPLAEGKLCLVLEVMTTLAKFDKLIDRVSFFLCFTQYVNLLSPLAEGD